MPWTKRDYIRQLDNPGYNDSLSLMIDWMEDLLREGYPVWQKLKDWAQFINQEYFDHLERHNNSWEELRSSYLHISLAEHFPSYNLKWPKWMAEKFAGIKHITLFRGAVRQLPEWFGFLSNLSVLEIDEWQTELQSLEFKQSSIWNALPPLEIPEWLANTPMLSKLSLRINSKIKLDSTFCDRSQIQELEISNTQNIISPLIKLPSTLQIINLYNIGPMNILPLLQSLHQLIKLSLGEPQFQEIPLEIRHLSNLQYLHIENSQIDLIPSWITDLSQLKYFSLKTNNENMSEKREKNSFFEFPLFLQNCKNLVWIEVPTTPECPVRTLFGLPSIVKYWVALNATYPKSNYKYYIDLPPSIYRRIHTEFQISRSDNIPIEQWDFPIKESQWTFHLPHSLKEIEIYNQYTNEQFCPLCHRIITNYRSDLCHLDYHLAPSLHQALIAFLAEYYRDSSDTLMQKVKGGIILSDLERERFVHECDYHYWQILLNDHLPTQDPRLLEELTVKFSVQLSNDHKMLL